MRRPNIFISYSHADEAWKDRLVRHLRVLKSVAVWEDRQIAGGDEWFSEIQGALRRADIAVLLVSADFLTSEFIERHEVPALLQRRVSEGVRVMPLLVKPCAWEGIAWLAALQIRPTDARALSSGDENQVETDLAELTREIRDLVSAISLDPTPPEYPDPVTRDLSQTLEKAYERRAELELNGESTRDINETIVGLKRRMREDGHLKEGDFLLDGRFRLQELAGQGGFAQVWKAYDRDRHEFVAVKVLHTQHGRDKSRRDRFFRGARQMSRLRGLAGVVDVLEIECKDGGYHFFVMEYLAEGDFRRAVCGKRLSIEERLAVILEVGETLGKAHERGIVHRDVKPANILLDAGHRPKLTDFDLVRAADTTGGTRTSMLGTFLYAAPEAMSDAKEAAASADVYGLGMTAIFALHGEDLPANVVMRRLPEFLASLEVSEPVRQVIEKAVEWEPEDRWSTAGEVSAALKTALESNDPPPVDEPPPVEELPVDEPPTREREAATASQPPDGFSDRAQFFEGLPERLGDADACLAWVEQFKEVRRNGFDLYWLWWIVEDVQRRWSPGSRAQDLLDHFFDHIPPPEDEDLLRSFESKLDGQKRLWCPIPEGEGLIGSPDDEEDRTSDEGPQHRVITEPFWLGAVPVTNAQYAAFDPGQADEEHLASHPRIGVTWYEAVSFCRWLGTLPGFVGTHPRLPVEEEWEVACRAGTSTRFWRGNDVADLSAVGWFDKNSDIRTHRVGGKPANDFGLYDVHGNVLEWTASPWDGKRYQGRSIHEAYRLDSATASADLAAPPRVSRVLRGGGYADAAQRCRSAYRLIRGPWDDFGLQGFRVLLASAPSRG